MDPITIAKFGLLVLTIIVAIAALEFRNLIYTVASFAAVFGLLTAFGAWIAVIGEAFSPQHDVSFNTLVIIAVSATLIGGIGYAVRKWQQRAFQ